MAMLCAGIDLDRFRLIGQWRSDKEMYCYLHVQAQPVMSGVAADAARRRLPPQSSLPSCTLRRPCGTGCPTLRLAFGQQQWPACFRPPAHWAGEPANTTHSARGTSLEKAPLSPHSYTHTSYCMHTKSTRSRSTTGWKRDVPEGNWRTDEAETGRQTHRTP